MGYNGIVLRKEFIYFHHVMFMVNLAQVGGQYENLKEIRQWVWTGFILARIQSSGRLLHMQYKTSDIHKGGDFEQFSKHQLFLKKNCAP
jgi:hypothetical protein